METIKNAASSASETLQGNAAGAKKQGNEEIAKGNTDASLTERATAAKDAAGNKMDETKHDTKSEADKQAAKN